MNKWVLLFIVDGFGIGEAKDAKIYGDAGADTCGHLLSSQPSFQYPTLASLGLFDQDTRIVLTPHSPNKDTLSGIHELLGDILPEWSTFPEGFPGALLNQFESLIHHPVLNGGRGSGTEIIQRLGALHMQTGNPIVYTSADSVFQIAAHEERVPLSTLYTWSVIARSLVNDQPIMGRVIARPFLGNPDQGFSRTPYRKDYPYKSGQVPLLKTLADHQIAIAGNRIIQDLFPEMKIDRIPGQHNAETLESVLTLLKQRNVSEDASRLLIVDLEDFDMVYGHRRDTIGYAQALVQFDFYIRQCLSMLQSQDLCLLTADHGNDPTFSRHTDHTRENVPLVMFPVIHTVKGTLPMNTVASIILRHFLPS